MKLSSFAGYIDRGFTLTPDEDGKLPTEKGGYVAEFVVDGVTVNRIRSLTSAEKEEYQLQSEAYAAMGML